MYASREFQSAEYLTSDSPDIDDDEPQGQGTQGSRKAEALQRQESSDFGFIDLHQQQQQQGHGQEGLDEGEGLVSEQPVISAASLHFRASTGE